MRLGYVLILIVFNTLCISAMGQSSENPFGSATSDSTSLKGDIYYLPDTTTSLPDFSSLTPVGSIYTKVLDIPIRSFTSGFPGITNRFEWFAIRYTGTFNAGTEGDYVFRLVSDDGSRLFIDGKKIIDNDGIHATQSVSGNDYLTRGQHSIEVDYFQGPREEIALQLFWTPPGGSEGIANPQYIPSTPTSGTASVGSLNLDLTGVWNCDDGGMYYIRQSGDTIWWFGEPSTNPGSWSNAARGIIKDNIINLDWSDVPKGCTLNQGTLVLNVLSTDKLAVTEKTGGFGGSTWTRIASTACPSSTATTPGSTTTSSGSTTTIPGSTTTTSGNQGTLNPWDELSVRQLIDEWLQQQDRCVKQVYPGAYIDKWGRICGDTGTTTISCDLTPDNSADWDNYHYLWYNNWCPDYYPYRVQDYVELRQSGSSFNDLAECKGEVESCY